MPTELVRPYLIDRDSSDIDSRFLAYLANLEQVASVSSETARWIVQELADQRGNIKLIASENYSSLAVQGAMGNLPDGQVRGRAPVPPLLRRMR